MRLGPIGGIIFGALVLIAGLFALTWGIRGLHAAVTSKDWPTTEGTVVRSELEKLRKKGGAGSNQRKNRFTFKPQVHYEFEVDGQAYSGSRLTFSDFTTSNEDQMQEVIAPYPLGTKVSVHYDPKDPSECTLETGFGWTPVAITGAGCLLSFIGSLALFGSARRLRRPASA